MSVLMVLTVACGGANSTSTGGTTTDAASGIATSAPALPDISKLVPTVQAQITTQYDVLRKTLASGSATIIDRANAYGEVGKLLMAAQLPDGAQTALANAQALDPSDYRWPYYLAHIARTQGDLAKASGLFERVLQLQPDDMDSLVWLGDVNLAAGRADAAAPLFERALKRDPGSASAHYGAGRAALALGNHAAAVEQLEAVLRLNANAVAAHYPLSQAYAALGDQVKAAEHLRLRRDGVIAPADPLMVELDSLLESPQTFESLGIRRLDRQDWTGAAEQFRKGLALAPDSPSLHHRLATALSMMNDQAGAKAEFETAIAKSPDYFPSLYSLGVMLQADGKHAQAIERFSAALAARPDYPEARLRLASSLRRMGRVKEAVDSYREALSSAPDNTEARIGLAMTLSKLRRDREAQATLEEALTASGSDMVFMHAMARLLATSPDNSVRSGKRSMELVQQLLQRGRTLEVGETYAMALAELGQYREAQSLQRDLIAAAGRAGMTAMRARLTARLELYDRADPCRTPWTDEEMP